MARRTLAAVNERGNRVGEAHPHAKLTQADVNRMLDMRSSGWSLGQLARVFGIAKSTAQHVCSGRHWIHKPCGYVVVLEEQPRRPVVLNLEGIAPRLGAAPSSSHADDWVRPVADPLPNLPRLVAGQGASERAVELIAWALAGMGAAPPKPL